MGFVWATRGGLAPMRMVWHEDDHNYPRYTIRRWEIRNELKKHWPLRFWVPQASRIDDDRQSRRQFPGLLGQWPHNRKRRKRNPKVKKMR